MDTLLPSDMTQQPYDALKLGGTNSLVTQCNQNPKPCKLAGMNPSIQPNIKGYWRNKLYQLNRQDYSLLHLRTQVIGSMPFQWLP